MAVSNDDLRQAVDEVLEPAWPHERRRALTRLACSTSVRIAGFLFALWVLALVVRVVVGLTIPWTFFAFITVLVVVFGLPDAAGDRSHLRRD